MSFRGYVFLAFLIKITESIKLEETEETEA